ncbi:tachylectin-related carbohydrate-binding protein [Lentzea sp. BCCO 10_0856]|uniref:Tachylectin-related carbohydrate-binding protein n=1 Tax=Lentzea miocenica TaxID=3095431 RepID=A0ABU4T593_9PSEU|nr:tachylectin-related carbohydrate-binding protein [Lentzea sp. BCCO 10_0856]MDX8033334.1 tachylectin-related carbohydrate-binding protein [Lentzea sp. BCCO 10_0856]
MQISLAAIVGVVGLPILIAGNNVANAVETVSCKTANVFVGMANSNDFRLRKQTYPADGYPNWASDDGIGWGWNERFMAGPNGYIWFIETDGELRRHRWTGSTWENGGISELIASNWGGWDLPQYHFRVTVDSNNHIYGAEAGGNLVLSKYDETTKVLSRRVIAGGWDKYDQIVAAGDGVIYARDPNVNGGTLYRFKYDETTSKWFNYDTQQWQDEQWNRNVGNGWNGYKQITSPGGDILWGTFPGGETWWYRYMPKYNFWELNASGDWKSQIATWTGVDEIAPAIDSCTTGEMASDVDCLANAKIWGSQHNDQLWMRAHNEPETGVTSWQKPQHLGNGWNGSRFMAGAKGYKFFIEPDGEFRTHRWIDGTGWDNGGISKVAATGWGGWDQLPYHNRVTVDSNNHVYAAVATGQLEFHVFDEATNTLTQKQIIDDGWGKYDQVFAAGDGVLYARDPNIDGGTLYRFHYDWKNRRWLDYARNVGWGWNGYSQILSPGGDVVLGVSGSDIWWYRFDNTAKVFTTTAEGEPKKRISWWADLKEVMADIDSCKLTTPEKVTPPSSVPAPQSERAQMIYNQAKSRFEVAYVTDQGVLRRGWQSIPGAEEMMFQGMTGAGFTGRAALAQQNDNRLVLAARGTTAQARSYTQRQGGLDSDWNQPQDLNGALFTDPIVARGKNKVLTAFALDGANKLWFAEQFGPDGAFKGWRKAAYTTDYNMTSDMTILPVTDGFEIAYRNPTGTLAVKKFTNGTLATQRVAGGITGVGTPGAVVFDDGKVQLVSRGSDNKLYTTREGASGFPAWTNIGGALEFTGSPGVVLNAFGIVEVAIRDTGNLLHRGGQTAPGSTTWRVWDNTLRTVPMDPSFAASPSGEQRIFWRVDAQYYLLDAPAYTSNQSAAMPAQAAQSEDLSANEVSPKVTKGDIK